MGFVLTLMPGYAAEAGEASIAALLADPAQFEADLQERWPAPGALAGVTIARAQADIDTIKAQQRKEARLAEAARPTSAEMRSRLSAGVRLRSAKVQREKDEAIVNAAGDGKVETVSRLLAEGASQDAKNGAGIPALVWAASGGHLDVLKVLRREGADLEARNLYGDTALLEAAIRGQLDCVEELLRWGAQPNAADNDGETALHNAAREGQLACARLLLGNGAGRSKHNSKGQTPLDVARECWEQHRIIHLLQDFEMVDGLVSDIVDEAVYSSHLKEYVRDSRATRFKYLDGRNRLQRDCQRKRAASAEDAAEQGLGAAATGLWAAVLR